MLIPEILDSSLAKEYEYGSQNHRQAHKLDMLEQRTKPLDPMLMLQRGYTITTHNGHIIRDLKDIEPGDEIVTTTANGSIKSTVKE